MTATLVKLLQIVFQMVAFANTTDQQTVIHCRNSQKSRQLFVFDNRGRQSDYDDSRRDFTETSKSSSRRGQTSSRGEVVVRGYVDMQLPPVLFLDLDALLLILEVTSTLSDLSEAALKPSS